VSTTVIQAEFRVDGVLVDATTAKLSDAAGVYGVKRNDTDAVVVADGTDLTHDGTGLYSYSFTDPAADLTYTYALEFVYSGQTYRSTGTLAGGTSATYPITLAEAKAQCRVTGTDEDDLITGMIAAATEDAEAIQNRTFVSRTRTFYRDDFTYDGYDASGRGYIELPYPPLQSITSIAYIDGDGVTQTLSADTYTVDTGGEAKLPGRIYLAYGESWPTVRSQHNAVTITAVCGYSSVSAIPYAVKQAIKLKVGDLYEHREDTVVGPAVSNRDASGDFLWKNRIVPV
jgi:uncharacterized phiE125 gp8 family phage protein